jgi:hypothetical protein
VALIILKKFFYFLEQHSFFSFPLLHFDLSLEQAAFSSEEHFDFDFEQDDFSLEEHFDFDFEHEDFSVFSVVEQHSFFSFPLLHFDLSLEQAAFSSEEHFDFDFEQDDFSDLEQHFFSSFTSSVIVFSVV